MTLEQLREEIPEYAKDLRLNLSNAVRQTELTERQLWGTAVACALASHNARLYAAVLHDAAEHLDETTLNAAKSAAAIMGMNNIYYRSLHLMKNSEYQTLPARLRMNVIGNPGVEKLDFELWSAAVSAINGCGACLDAHEGELKKHGVANTQVQAALRIASVMNAASRVASAEAARQG